MRHIHRTFTKLRAGLGGVAARAICYPRPVCVTAAVDCCTVARPLVELGTDRQQQRLEPPPTLMAIELSTADWACSFVGNKAPQQQVHPNRELKT